MKLIKATSVLLLLAFLPLLLPIDSLHHLVEEHNDDLHQCESDLCVRSFEKHCELCDFLLPEYEKEVPVSIDQELSLERKLVILEVQPDFRKLCFSPPNKAPPIS